MRTFMILAALLACAGFLPAQSAEDVPPALSARLALLVPDRQPDHVAETALPGVYEVRYGSIVVYLSDDGRYMLRGVSSGEGPDDGEIESMIARRVEARARRDWAEADRLRDELSAAGIVLEDGARGTVWRRARHRAVPR